MTDRKKPTAAFWITVALVALLVGYPLSVGPAYWLADNVLPRSAYHKVEAVYWPLTIVMVQTETTTNLLNWYLLLFVNGLMPDDYPDDAPWP